MAEPSDHADENGPHGEAEGRPEFAENWGVPIDGMIFRGAHIHDNLLYYTGGPLPRFYDCLVERNQFSFQGPALNTVMFLNSLLRDMDPADRIPALKGMGVLPEDPANEP